MMPVFIGTHTNLTLLKEMSITLIVSDVMH